MKAVVSIHNLQVNKLNISIQIWLSNEKQNTNVDVFSHRSFTYHLQCWIYLKLLSGYVHISEFLFWQYCSVVLWSLKGTPVKQHCWKPCLPPPPSTYQSPIPDTKQAYVFQQEFLQPLLPPQGIYGFLNGENPNIQNTDGYAKTKQTKS